jgi:hypothetical protein
VVCNYVGAARGGAVTREAIAAIDAAAPDLVLLSALLSRVTRKRRWRTCDWSTDHSRR